jgi:hypothetical protein
VTLSEFLADVVEILKTPPALVIAAVVGLLLIAKATPWFRVKFGGLEAERDSPSKPYVAKAAEAAVTSRATRIDLEQFGEVAVALEALVDAKNPQELEPMAREWFSMLATRLASRLKEERDHHYRAAIWLDDESHPDHFVCIGHGLFNPNDTDMDMLERANTIGGLAFKSATMSYYCRDRKTDPNFKPRHEREPSFLSVFGLALGKPNNPWAVMTVDARTINGFSDDAQWLIRRFGELASFGAVVWAMKATPPVPPASAAVTKDGL